MYKLCEMSEAGDDHVYFTGRQVASPKANPVPVLPIVGMKNNCLFINMT